MNDRRYEAVIVGGGSAGAVLAARLSEQPDRTVLLLEAGPAYAPGGYPPEVAASASIGPFTGHDWGYVSEPGFVGHPIPVYRGKVLGGSSAMNASVAVRALPSDFARWTQRGLEGWSFEEVLPDYLTLEHASGRGDDGWHGNSGPLPIHQLGRDELSPMQRAFIDAAVAQGLPATTDFNGASREGAGPLQVNVVDGVRVNTGIAYLTDDVRRRPNLEIRANAMVDRVLFGRGRATAVRLADGTDVAAEEVILSAGAYGSPAILLRSGVGPSKDLEELGIPVVADLPVGRRLQDQPTYHNAYAAKPDRIGVQSPLVGATVWAASAKAGDDELDIQISAIHIFPDPSQSPTGIGFVLEVGLMRPASLGSLTLVNRDPRAPPHIDLNFLARGEDRERLLEGIRLARRIAATSPLADLIERELNPAAAAMTDIELEQSMLATVDTFQHPACTAPMGPDDDPAAVVDRLGAVRGVKGLRIVDACIFPDLPSVPLNPTVIMTAEHIARLAY